MSDFDRIDLIGAVIIGGVCLALIALGVFWGAVAFAGLCIGGSVARHVRQDLHSARLSGDEPRHQPATR